MWPLTFDSPRAIEATGFPRHGQGAKRPVFDKFVEIMRPKDAGISTTTKTEVMFRQRDRPVANQNPPPSFRRFLSPPPSSSAD